MDQEKLIKVMAGTELCKPIPFVETLEIDNSELSPVEVVDRIIKHYDLLNNN